MLRRPCLSVCVFVCMGDVTSLLCVPYVVHHNDVIHLNNTQSIACYKDFQLLIDASDVIRRIRQSDSGNMWLISRVKQLLR